MCGIAGIVAPTAARYRHALERMVDALRHRGPDGNGVHVFGDCALGHTRLSIVDLATGDQPMLAGDGRAGVTFNGEIYGYRDLRSALGDYPFRTASDTEVILALYQRHGTRLLDSLPGMFAFALWDDRERRLVAARDRFGEKPFFYAWGDGGEFLFASEIRALLAARLFSPRLDPGALPHFLQYGYVHPHQTIYANVHTLPPAHALRWESGRVTVERYWRLPPPQAAVSPADAVREFGERFKRAVSRQLVADVPVSAFLSGGLDSSSIVAAASRVHPRLRTLAFGFDGAVSELPFAREVAALHGTDHVELHSEPASVADLLVEMARVYDEPLADSSCIPTYLICQAARRHGKVVLTGDGGDELLGGYTFWYRPLWEMERAGPSWGMVASLLRAGEGLAARAGLQSQRLARAARGAELRRRYGSVVQAHRARLARFAPDELRRLSVDGTTSSPLDALAGDSLDQAIRLDLETYLPGDILVKTDRASMAHGLELRAPFLDVELASFCISLPSRLKVTARTDKWLLREAYAHAWTESVRRRGKKGFGAPVRRWLAEPGVAAVTARILHDAAHPLFSLVSFEGSRQAAGAGDTRTWILLVLGLWLEQVRGFRP
jgi:asparagine synthase (glutamine-hydrolysing)